MKKEYKLLGVLTLVGLVIRLLCSFTIKHGMIPDAITYLNSGQFFFETGTIQSFKVMPIYPIISYLNYLLGNFHMLDIILSSLTIPVIYFLAIEMFKKKSIGFLSAFLFCVYPFSVYYSYAGLTETSFVFFLTLGFLKLYQRKYVAASIFLVLSILIRPTTDILNPILIFLFSWFIHEEQLSSTLKNVLKYSVVYVLLMSPWWMHNYANYNQFVRLNLGFGEMIYGGNNYNNISNTKFPEVLDYSDFKHIDDRVEKDKALVRSSLECILNNKINFLKKSIRRFLYFWNVVPNHQNHRAPWVMAVSFISVFSLILGSLIAFIIGKKDFFLRIHPILLFAIYLTLIHTITIASIRYRYPIEPFMIIFLAYSLYHILKQRITPLAKLNDTE